MGIARSHRQAISPGVVLFACGFGAMNVLWWAGEWPRDLPGLWNYRTMTVGDAVLLPVAATILAAARARLPKVPAENRVRFAAGLVGAVVGAAVEVLWLLNPDPQLNWQQTQPHRFTLPGYYHAVFLVLGCSYFAASVAQVLWQARIRRTTHPATVENMFRTPSAAILVACALGFAGLVALDSVPNLDTASGIAPAGAMLIALFAISLALLWGFGRSVIRAWKTLGAGVCLAFSVCLVSWFAISPTP